jgi:DNA polymerase-3 subunit alpha
VGIYISGHPLDDFRLEMKYFCNSSLAYLSDLSTQVNKEFTMGVVVSDVQHRVSKNGKGWAIFTVEDYNESYEFKIFGEEYLKHRHFLMINNFVRVRLFIKEGWTNKDTGKKGEPRIQFRDFSLLHDVIEENAKKLTIQLNVEELSDQQIISLQELFHIHKGDHLLNFVVYELQEKIKLHMPSRRQKVKICQELITELESQNIQYKLN